MALNFRRSFKIAPGIKLNLNKNSTSITVQSDDMKFTKNSNGKETVSVGIPGTGIYYTKTINKNKENEAMKLMTKEIEAKLEKAPFGSSRCSADTPVIVKYFNPYGAGTWLITEGERTEDGDWELFGYCHIHEWEWGYVMFSEIKNCRVPPFNLPLERDLYCKGKTVGDLAPEAFEFG